jgi:hypothetical protein
MRFPVHRARVRANFVRAAAALCALVGCVWLCGTPAQAAVGHAFSSSFGAFTSATGIAVDDSTGTAEGEVYVVDRGAGQVDRFTASEAAKGEAGQQLTGVTLVAPFGVAVDDSSDASRGDVYVTDPAEGVIDKFNGVTGKYESQIDGSETPDVQSRGFEPAGVGVDPANGDVFVSDAHNGVVDVFTAAGKYSAQFGSGQLGAPRSVAVNGEGDAYVATAGGEAFELLAAGGYASALPVGVGVNAVSIDPANGDVYLDEGSSLEQLNANAESLGAFGSGSLGGSTDVAVNSATGTVYSSSSNGSAGIFVVGETPTEPVTTESPTGVTGFAATFKGALSGGETGYDFAYDTGQSCTGGGSSEPGEVTGSVEVSTAVSGLAPATQYTVCLVASNAFGQTQGSPVTFTTSAVAPRIEGESFSNVGSGSAMLNAQVNPQGSPSTYYYEYGPTNAYGSKTTEASLGGGAGALSAPAQVVGLTPGGEYHFRVVAVNQAGVEPGNDVTFHALPVGIQGLPDGRAYEMVNPVENNDANLYVPKGLPAAFTASEGESPTKLPFQVAVDGDAVAYVGDPTVQGNGNRGYGEGVEYRATRLSGGGWSQVTIQPAVKTAFYQAFSPDLSLGILQSGSYQEPEGSPLSSGAPGSGYAVLYARALDNEIYQPLFTATPLNRGPSDFRTAGMPQISLVVQDELVFAGASADFGKLLFEANDAFAGSGAVDGGAEENNLYESVEGRLSLVNVLPGGSTEANATFGAPPFSRPGENLPDFSNVISADGSRVFWTDLNTGDLYVSEGVGSSQERTVQVDASQASGEGGGGRFWTASKDGSKVFFTDSDSAGLTTDTQAGSGENLYLYEVATGHLTDLTATAEAGVEGVLGEGESGSGEYTMYFVATGVLGSNENSEGAKAQTGADNLYMLREGAQPTFIAVLAPEDGNHTMVPLSRSGYEEFGDWQPGLGHRTAQVAPDGRGLVFMSIQSLTGYHNVVDGRADDEVYVYEAEDNRLFCASCNRSGEVPQVTTESEASLAAFLPVSWSKAYMPQLISEDGSTVFFDSDEPLVPQDTNGEQDVYEWERDGAGSCREASGCVYLLSGGGGDTSSWLVGGSESGNDVFFVTRAQLVPGEGKDEAYNLFDARIGGGSVAAPSCSGTGCQGVPSAPPTFATPPSVTFAGVGNFAATAPVTPAVKTKSKIRSLTKAQKLAKALKACVRQTSKRKRGSCEARARERYGPKAKSRDKTRKSVGGKVRGRRS